MDRIEAKLLAQHPDVLFLQEAEVADDATATSNLLPRFAKALGGYEIVSSQTLGLPADQHCDVAILSRWPIRSVAAHSLEPKGWVYAVEGRISIDAGDLSLMSIHTHATWRLADFAHVRESTQVRTRQLQRIVARTREIAHPVILAGDFNAPAGTAEAAMLSSQLVDLAPEESRAPTTPAMLPVLRLDYIFASQPSKVVTFETLNIKLSDHRPVIAVISWPMHKPS